MTAHASSLPVTFQHFFAADEQSKQSFGGRLIRAIMAQQERRADREILRFSSIQHDSYRAEFGLELERRVMGQ
jgi:uncharacterized heparinase superfamily protein